MVKEAFLMALTNTTRSLNCVHDHGQSLTTIDHQLIQFEEKWREKYWNIFVSIVVILYENRMFLPLFHIEFSTTRMNESEEMNNLQKYTHIKAHLNGFVSLKTIREK